jgi:hypothetical protein
MKKLIMKLEEQQIQQTPLRSTIKASKKSKGKKIKQELKSLSTTTTIKRELSSPGSPGNRKRGGMFTRLQAHELEEIKAKCKSEYPSWFEDPAETWPDDAIEQLRKGQLDGGKGGEESDNEEEGRE